MTTTTKAFDNATQVRSFISTLTNGYAAICDSFLIDTDGKTSIRHWMDIDKDCKKYKIPYKFYIGIRTRGVESSENVEHIIERIKFFGDSMVCSIAIQYLASIKKYVVAYTRAMA